MRVGMGYDVHKLTEDRKLILGGVEIPYEKGLLGHSDADVLLHAIMDALLGAAALGDIGKHFPDIDPQYKGISSIKLLEHVAALLDEILMRRSLPSVRKCVHILIRCGKILQRHLAWKPIRSMSRQRQKRAWALPEQVRGFLLRQSVQSRNIPIIAV